VTYEEHPKVYLYKRIVQAKLFIDNNFNGHIDLENIAGEAHFSKFHFIRLFKSIYGSSPHQYLTKVRIEKAKNYLQQGVSISDTCFKVGFDSISSFTGLFKQHTTYSPAFYQQRFFKRQEEIKRMPLQFIPNCFAEQKGWTKKSNFEEAR
jgi:AraC-like DNA-binding protein